MATPLAGWADKQRDEFDREVRSRFFRNIDFAGPEGDPGWFGPDSAVWYVHASYPAIALGLFAAAYLEGLDPSIVSMGTDHSRIPERIGGIPTGKVSAEGAAVRFGHSLSFFLGTAFASTESAERLAKIVRSMHHTVKGTRPDGATYDAEDPEWLRWNYATVVWGLATAHERYHPQALAGADLDRYYREFTRVGHALGGTDLPASKAEVLDCLEAYLPRLAVTHFKASTTGSNLDRKANPLLSPTGPAFDWVVRDLLPPWAQTMVFHRPMGPTRTAMARATMRTALRQLDRAMGELPEVTQARARVAGGMSHPVDADGPGAVEIERGISRERVEAMA